ncbi:flavin reductase family protein [Streptomyces sp. BI20]|uniref:flavin reductase family protein n=1 Tax=Streptomyces sp. BI20 TaxID=3403460 RepID=UPI003C781450
MPQHTAPPPPTPPEPPEPPAGGPGPVDLRPFMAAFPTGVSVVTTVDTEARPHGLTCSSVASVALAPPTLMVGIRTASPTLAVLLAQGRFTLNLLHEGARAVSDLFASGDPDRFDHVDWRLPLGAGGPHLIESAHAFADCAVERALRIGDHTAVFARVSRVTVREDPAPLLYGLRRYGAWSTTAPPPSPAPTPAPVPAQPPAHPRRPAPSSLGVGRVGN